MTKSKSKSEVEYLRGVVRNQRSEIKNLKKELSRKIKQEQHHQDVEDLLSEQLLEEEFEDLRILEKEKCPECNSTISSIELGQRILYMCDNCKFRKTVTTSG